MVRPPSQEVSFWMALSKLKLEEHRLQTPRVDIIGYFGNAQRRGVCCG